MPLYEYECLNKECGHKSETVRPSEERDAPLECSKCGQLAVRVLSKTSSPQFKDGGWTPKFYR